MITRPEAPEIGPAGPARLPRAGPVRDAWHSWGGTRSGSGDARPAGQITVAGPAWPSPLPTGHPWC